MPLLPELRGGLTAFALVLSGLLVLASYDFGIPGQALLQSLRFHLAATMLGLVIVLFVSGTWYRGVLFLAVFALSAGHGAWIVYTQQQARMAVAEQTSRPLLRMLSFNLLQTNFGNGRQIADFIIGSGADLVLVMEGAPVAPFAAELAQTYPYRSKCAASGPCDLYLLSKTPLMGDRTLTIGQVWPNRLVVATTIIGGETINIVGAHMAKPYFDNFAEEEAWNIRQVIGRTQGPLVLAGDFNAAAWSHNIDRLARTTKLIPPPSYPATWPIRLGPLGVPIDNMWTRGPLFIASIRALDDSMGSNHRGIMAELSLAATPSAPATPAAAQ